MLLIRSGLRNKLEFKTKVNLGTRCSFKMSKNMNKHATKRKSAPENSILKFLTVSSVSSDSIVKGIINDIIKMAVKTAEAESKKQRKHEKLSVSYIK